MSASGRVDVIGARQARVMQLMSIDERPLFALEIGDLNVSSGSSTAEEAQQPAGNNRPLSGAREGRLSGSLPQARIP